MEEHAAMLTQPAALEGEVISDVIIHPEDLPTHNGGGFESSLQVRYDDMHLQCEKYKSENVLLHDSLEKLKNEVEKKNVIDRQCETLTQSVAGKETTIACLKAQLGDMQLQASIIESLQTERNELVLQCEEYKSENLLLQKSLDDLKVDVECKEGNLVDVKDKYEKTMLENQTNCGAVRSLETQLQSLKQEIEERNSSICNLKQQCEILTHSAKEKDMNNTGLKSELEDLQAQTCSKETLWQVKYDDLVDQYEKQKSENLFLEESLEKSKSESRAVDDLLSDMKSKYDIIVEEKLSHNNIVTDLEKQIQNLKGEIDFQTSTCGGLEQQCQTLTHTLSEKQVIITNLRTQMDDLQTQMREVADQCEQHKSENTLLLERFQELKSDFEAKENVLTDLKAQYDKVAGELQAHQSNGDAIIGLENQIFALKTEIESQTSTSNCLESQCETLTKSVLDKEANIAELNKQLNDLQKESVDNEASWQVRLDEAVQQHKSENLLLHESLTKLRSDCDAKESILLDLKAQNEKISEDLQTAHRANDEKEATISELNKLMDELQSDRDAKENILLDLKAQNEKISEDLQTAHRANDEKEATISELNKLMDELQSNRDAKENILLDLKAQNEKISEDLQTAHRANDEKEATISELNKLMDELQSDRDAKENSLLDLKAQNEKISEDLQTAHRANDGKEATISELNKLMDELQSDHDAKENILLDLKAQNEKISEDLQTAHRANDEKEATISELNKLMDELQSDRDAKENILLDLKAQNEKISEELQTAHRANDEKERETLKHSLTEKEVTISELNKLMDELQTKLSDNEISWQVKHDEAVSGQEQHKAESQVLQESLAELKFDFDAKENALLDMRAKYEKVSQELQTAQQANHDVMIDFEKQLLILKTELETQNARFDLLESECECLKHTVTEKEATITGLKKQIDELQTQISDNETWQVRHVEAARHCETMKTESVHLQDCVEKLKTDLQAKDNLLFDMESKYEQLSDHFQEKCSELIIALSEKQMKSDIAVDLELKLQTLKDEMTRQTCSFVDLESRLKKLQEDNLIKQSDIFTTSSLLTESKFKCEQLAQQITNKEAEFFSVLELKSSLLSDMEMNCDKLSQELQDKSYELILSLTETQFNRDLVEDLEKQVHLLKCEMESKTANDSALESQLMALREENLCNHQELLSAKYLLSEKEKTQDQLTVLLEEKETELNASLCNHQSKDNKILQMQNEMQTLMADLQFKTSTIAELEQTNEILKQNLITEQETSEMQNKLDNLEKTIVDSKAELESEKMNCDALRQEIEFLKISNKELNSLVVTYQGDLDTRMKENSDLETQVVGCKGDISSLKTECSSLASEVESKAEMLQQAETRLNILQHNMIEKDELISHRERMINEMKEKLYCHEQRLECNREENEVSMEPKMEASQMNHNQSQQMSRNENELSPVDAEKAVVISQLKTFKSEVNDLKLNMDSVTKKSKIIFAMLSEERKSDSFVKLDSISDDEEMEKNNDLMQEKGEFEITLYIEECHKTVLYISKEITELHNHLDHLETAITSTLSSCTSKIANLKSALESLTTDRDSLNTVTKELEQQNSDLRNCNVKIDELCKDLQITVSEQGLKISNLNTSLSLKEEENASLQALLEGLKAEVAQRSNELETLVEKKEKLEISLSDMKKEAAHLQTIVEGKTMLKLDNTPTQIWHNVDTNGNGGEFVGMKGVTDTDYRQELDCVRKENETLIKERLEQNLNEIAPMKGNSDLCNESFSNHKFEEKEQLWNLTVEKESLQKCLDQNKVELNALKLRLESEKDAERKAADINERITQFHFEISELRCQLDCAEAEKSAIEKDFDAMKNDNVQLMTALNDIQGRLQELKSNELNLSNEAIKCSAELNDFQMQYEKLFDMIAKANPQTSEGDTGKRSLKYTKGHSKSNLKLKPDSTNMLNKIMAEKEILEKRVRSLENELSEAKMTLEERSQRMETDHNEKMEVSFAQGSDSDLQLRLTEVQTEKCDIETERNALIEKNKEFTKDYQQVQDQNKILELKIEEFSCAAQDVGNDLRKLHGVIKDQNETLTKRKKEIVAKANEIETLRTDLAELFTKIQGKQKEIDSLTEELSTLKKESKDSKSNLGTLEDVIEALNLDMATLEDEKSSLTSSLEKAEEKINEQQCELLHMKQTIEESNNEVVNSGKCVGSLTSTIEELEKENKELNSKVKEMHELGSALREKVNLSQIALEKKCTECDDLIFQLAESKSEIAESVKKAMHLQEKLLQSEYQVSELTCKVNGNEEKMTMLLEEKEKSCVALKNKDFEITNLMKIKEDLETKQEEMILVYKEKDLCVQRCTEETQKCETLKSSNESLLCHLKEKEDEIFRLSKRLEDSSESSECLKNSVISELKVKQDEIDHMLESQQSVQKQLSEIEKNALGLEEEMRKKDDEILKLSTKLSLACDELQQAKSEKDDTNIKIQNIEQALSDKDKMLKQMEEELRTRLSEALEVAKKIEREKEKLSNQLLEIQSTSYVESGKESKQVLRRWEERCKELDSNLTMERKKCQGLTEQINALKGSNKSDDSVQEIEELKSELDEVKKDRDCMRDERQQFFLKAKQHKDKADLLNCKIRVLNHMLKKQGKKSQAPIQDNKVGSKGSESPIPCAEKNVQIDSKQYNPVSNSDKISSSMPNCSSKLKLCPVDNRSNDKDKVGEISKMKDGGNIVEKELSSHIPPLSKEYKSPPVKKSSPLSLRKRVSKLSTVQGLESDESKKEGESAQANPEVKADLLSESESNKIPPSPPKACPTRPLTRKRKSSQSSQVSLTKDSSSQDGSQASEILEDQEFAQVTRVTRRSALRKREATDPLPSATESKKSQVIYEDPMTWLEGPSKPLKQAKVDPPLSVINKSNLSGPATRSKVKETSKVLNPITNSPVKDSQHRPKGFLRQASRMSEKRAQVDHGKDEAAQNCNTQ